MQRQIGQVLDELEKADYYGSGKLKSMAPMIRKECAFFLATLEKYMQSDSSEKDGVVCGEVPSTPLMFLSTGLCHQLVDAGWDGFKSRTVFRLPLFVFFE